MLRMDMLLNPGSPPASPVRESVPALDNSYPKVFQPTPTPTPTPATAPTIFPRKDVLSVLPSELDQRSNQEDHDESDVEPATKRLKRELPGVRVLLESIDNQRDDDRNSIFSGHAFWGQVPSLNQSTSPSDVGQYPLPSTVVVPTVSFAVPQVKPIKPKTTKTPRTSFMSDLSSVLAAPTVEMPHTNEGLEEVDPSEAGDSVNGTGKKKKITICKEDGCRSQALSKQLCMKHGGGPRCSIDSCNNGAKLKNLCFQHGGSTICLAPGCSSKSKRFGYCWSHGGGRICREEGCSKVSAQGGMCWAHGGGNRCKLPGCTKRSYKQHDYYCKRHAEQCADY